MALSVALPEAPVARTDEEVSAWVRDLGPSVHRTLRRLGVPDNQVEDAMQQVFLTAARRRDAVEPGKEKAFLLRIAVHTAAHVRRTFARRRESPLGDVEPPSTAASPEDAVAQQRLRAMLDAILGSMPDELREPFVLHEIEGLALPAIAELLEIPLGTATSRLRRARERFAAAAAKLRAQMGETR